ncbi:substrate-binding domain-containing protein [Rhizobium mongolense]|uniref:Simple sugar transport system substrate-binding protein n=2 Tax=Rhizobium mongolense TaxID=57676 RepID=A0ABR6IHA6_9HYPH|nr:substrate-binding domain-containing protein [Rhizobium mongolense]MBB4227120.1 simple sugar transport system substrate-binding protein [Rhizobium mongolense]TVZ74289.1 simple sugar transport system substrate-binding protein [Rhizobium mongolense USDA 1844]
MKRLKRIAAAVLATSAIMLGATCVEAANIAVVGGKTDDEFWSRIKKGVDDARLVVEKNGGSVSYLQLQTYDNLGPDAAQLVRTAMSQGVTGIVVPDWVPEAEDEAIKAAVQAGIKVILMNAGNIEKARELGAINYVGSDEYVAGKAGGEYLGSKGAKNVICVNTVPGAANQEARCKGVIDGITAKGGQGKQLPLPATSFGDQTAIAEAVKATLIQDDSIDGIINVSATDADAAASGINQAGKVGKVSHGTFDLNASGLARIKDGTQTFAIDQQPYLQSILSVTLLASHLDYGTNLPTAPVLTGPGIVDASNIDATMAGVKSGAR